MSFHALITLAVILIMVVALVREWVAPAIAVVTAMITLLVLGVIDTRGALAGFSNPAPITVAALFVLARAVEKTGALQPFVAGMLSVGGGESRSLLRLLLPTAAASCFFNNTPIVAMLVPQVSAWARRHGKPVALYLLPISFAAILGGMVTLVGTSTNLIVSGMLEEAGQEPLGMFEMTGVGGVVAVLGLVAVALLAPRTLRVRQGPLESFDAAFREYAVEMEVEAGGPVDGATVESAGLRHLQGVFLARIGREDGVVAPVAPDEVLRGRDLLGFVGRADLVVDLQAVRGLRSAEHKHAERFRDARHNFVEAVISPISPLVGQTLAECDFREQYGAAVLAIHRAGDRIRDKLGTVRLRAGDTLLLLADQGFRGRWRDRRDFLLVANLDGALPVGSRRGMLVLATAAAVVTLAAIGVLPVLKGALIGAVVMVATGTLTPNEARSALNLDVLIVIAAAFGLGAAIEQSGLAAMLAGGLVVPSQVLGTSGALLAVVLSTILLTELITNNAAAVMMFPVAQATALAAGGDPRSFAIAVALAASASFLTPIGYQTNTMVYGPGGYRFLDYGRLGAPVTVIVVVVITVLLAR
jgi:di/tricarboxylate transporter